MERPIKNPLEYLRTKWPFFALITLYVYLSFHAFSGSQGLMRWVDYDRDIKRNETHLAAVTAKRIALEEHANGLKAKGLDLDELDIKAREILFVSQAKEKTIWLDQTP